jgi:YbgC/YbaW family acyl-CoA thioester hydrolase
MPRIKIDMPTHFAYETDMEVRVTDLNYGNHLGNDRVLAFAHEARARYIQWLGYGELNIEGLGIIVADCAVVYKSEAFFGDVLRIQIACSDFNKYGFDMLYRISNKATGAEVALAKTGIVCFNYASRKVASLPEAFQAKLST